MHVIDSYKEKYQISDESFAKKAGISVDYIRKIRYGERIPSKDVAVKISRATHGEISVEEILFPEGVPQGACVSKSGIKSA